MKRVDKPHRVVITGLGLITPLGTGKDAVWRSVLDGRVAVAPITRFDSAPFSSHVAAQIDDFDPDNFLSRRRVRWTDRFSQLAVGSSRLALEDARFSTNGERGDVGVYTGSALGGIEFAEDQIKAYHREGLSAIRPLLTISVFGGAAACNIALDFKFTGPAIANADSCASGTIAIGQAYDAIARGDIRAALAGGIEAPLAPLTFGAFAIVRAMSTRNDDPATASRPFDRDRDGFVMAEGAGMLLLERYDDALARGVEPYCEIVGFGASNDAHHMSSPRPDGSKSADAMVRALEVAGCSPEDVDAINAHGSSTRVGDAAEARALTIVFGARAGEIPTSATKGQHGHALGATGAWEMAFSALSLRDGVIPGTVNLQQADDDLRVGVRRETVTIKPRTILSNSAGFGGINAAVVLRAL